MSKTINGEIWMRYIFPIAMDKDNSSSYEAFNHVYHNQKYRINTVL